VVVGVVAAVVGVGFGVVGGLVGEGLRRTAVGVELRSVVCGDRTAVVVSAGRVVPVVVVIDSVVVVEDDEVVVPGTPISLSGWPALWPGQPAMAMPKRPQVTSRTTMPPRRAAELRSSMPRA
jgi:hypothetical protein